MSLTPTRPARRLLAAAAAGALLTVGAQGAASAAPNPQPSDASVVTPLLHIFQFGDSAGLPLACGLAGSLVNTGADQVHGGAAASPVVSQINDLCTKLSDEGATYLDQAVARSKALTFVNPVLNPAIEALATNTAKTGSEHGGQVAPFGPTIGGLGGTIAFFEGS